MSPLFGETSISDLLTPHTNYNCNGEPSPSPELDLASRFMFIAITIGDTTTRGLVSLISLVATHGAHRHLQLSECLIQFTWSPSGSPPRPPSVLVKLVILVGLVFMCKVVTASMHNVTRASTLVWRTKCYFPPHISHQQALIHQW